MISDVAEAYQMIGELLASRTGSSSWTSLELRAPVLGKGLGGTTTQMVPTSGVAVDLPVGVAIFQIQDAVLFLRDDLLRTTGQRIWGMRFVLYPTGKFNVDYDYTMPEGYEETDETISLSDAMKRLGANLEHDGPKQD